MGSPTAASGAAGTGLSLPLLPAAAFVGGIGSLLYLGGTRTIDAITVTLSRDGEHGGLDVVYMAGGMPVAGEGA